MRVSQALSTVFQCVSVALGLLCASASLVADGPGLVDAARNGNLDSVAVERLRQYEDDLYRFLDTRFPGLLGSIAEKKILDDDIKKALGTALDEFGKDFAASVAA